MKVISNNDVPEAIKSSLKELDNIITFCNARLKNVKNHSSMSDMVDVCTSDVIFQHDICDQLSAVIQVTANNAKAEQVFLIRDEGSATILILFGTTTEVVMKLDKLIKLVCKKFVRHLMEEVN